VTTIVQPPFYIPRPAEDQLWSKGPINAPIIIAALTQQKMFGAGGQVPTKQWHYDYQETGTWQVTSETLNSASLQILTAGGKPFHTQWRYDYNESSHWYPAADTLNSFLALTTANVTVQFYSPLYVPRPSDPPEWNRAWVLPHPSLSQTFTPPTLARQPNYNFNETSNWQWSAPATAISLQTVPYKTSGMVVNYADDAVDLVIPPRKTPTTIFSAPQASPFAPLQWKPQSVDDWSVWQWQALRSDIAAIVTVGGQPPQKKWNGVFDYNDASHWFPWANRDLVIRTAQATPVIPIFWPYQAYNESAVTWQQPRQLSALITALPQAKPFVPPVWPYNADDPQMWARATPKDSLLTPLLGLRPNFNFWSWNYNADQPAIWQQPHQGLLNGPFPPPVPPPIRINPWWAWNIDERAVWWQQTPQRGFLSTAIVPITGVPSLAFCVDIPVFSASALDAGLFVAIGSDSPSGQGWSGAGYMATYEIDTDIQINGIFINALTGVDIDPTAITLFMLNPNGVATSYSYPGTITRDSLGHFHQQLVPSVSGTWTYKWQATGAAVCTSPDTTFTVKSSLLIPG
jgi:hypothetical protein